MALRQNQKLDADADTTASNDGEAEVKQEEIVSRPVKEVNWAPSAYHYVKAVSFPSFLSSKRKSI